MRCRAYSGGAAEAGPGVRRGGQVAGKLPDPPHPVHRRLRVVTELLGHQTDATADAKLPDGPAGRLRHRRTARGLRTLEPGNEQGRALRIVHGQAVHSNPPRLIGIYPYIRSRAGGGSPGDRGETPGDASDRPLARGGPEAGGDRGCGGSVLSLRILLIPASPSWLGCSAQETANYRAVPPGISDSVHAFPSAPGSGTGESASGLSYSGKESIHRHNALLEIRAGGAGAVSARAEQHRRLEEVVHRLVEERDANWRQGRLRTPDIEAQRHGEGMERRLRGAWSLDSVESAFQRLDRRIAASGGEPRRQRSDGN